jgi:hypothetical protein
MASVTHVEGDVTATFVISPLQGSGGCLRGTYREHAAGNFLIINGEDVPPGRVLLPARDRHRRRRLPQICFTSRGQFVLDKLIGEVRRNTISTCRVG